MKERLVLSKNEESTYICLDGNQHHEPLDHTPIWHFSTYIIMENIETRDLTWQEFQRVEMRVGTVVSAEIFKEARNPAYKMTVDFGPFGMRKTSAQITALYTPGELVGRQVVAVINFPPKQIANLMSECLVLGGIGADKSVTLLGPERQVENGTRIG